MDFPTSPPLNLDSERERVAAIARSWIGTPYRLGARVKGGGADCAQFLLGVLIEAGLSEEQTFEAYRLDWHNHEQDDRYRKNLLRRAVHVLDSICYRSSKIDTGCIVALSTFKNKVFHGGFVVGWPKIVHCIYPGIEEADASRHPMWTYRPISVYDPFKLEKAGG